MCHRLVVHDVIDLAGPAAFQGSDNGPHRVVAVDLVARERSVRGRWPGLDMSAMDSDQLQPLVEPQLRHL